MTDFILDTLGIELGSHETFAAYERVRDLYETIEDDQLVPVKANVPRAVGIALTTYAAVLPHREALIENVAGFDVGYLDELPDVAKALWRIENEYQTRSASTSATYERGLELRKQLMHAATGLAMVGKFTPQLIAKVNTGKSKADVASALETLSRHFRDKWDLISEDTWLTEEAVKEANGISLALVSEASGHDKVVILNDSALHVLRLRAFTILVLWYSQVRKALTFLRWEQGDADKLAPSLYKRVLKDKPKVSDPEVSDNDSGPADSATEGSVAEGAGEVAPIAVAAGAPVTSGAEAGGESIVEPSSLPAAPPPALSTEVADEGPEAAPAAPPAPAAPDETEHTGVIVEHVIVPASPPPEPASADTDETPSDGLGEVANG